MYVRLKGWHTQGARAKGVPASVAEVGSYDYQEYSIYIDAYNNLKLTNDSDLRNAIHNFNYHNNAHFHKLGIPPRLQNIWVWWPDIENFSANPKFVLSEIGPNNEELMKKLEKEKNTRYDSLLEYGTF